MSMRISSALSFPLALIGCGGADHDAPQPPAAGRIACSTAPAAPFARDCTVEQATVGDAVVLTVRNADGGFRRLQVTRDGRGLIAADGAEAAKVSVTGPDEIEVAIGGARYRLPATVGPVARP